MHPNRRGFTLVELMFAVVFISILLIAIAMLTIQIINIYTKGTTLNAANQAGQQISSELQQRLNQSKPLTYDDVIITPDGTSFKTARLCTGSVSYVFNSPLAKVNDDYVAEYEKNTVADPQDTTLRFVKVDDPGKALCSKNQVTNKYPLIDRSKSNDLLADDKSGLVVYKFSVSIQSINGGQTIYAINMTLGTNTGQENITDTSNCKPPSEGDDDFCAVNNFEFTARSANQQATGGGK